MKRWTKKKDWLGNEYWEDQEGNRKYVREDWLGNKYEEDEKGNRIYIRKDWLGNTYKVDENGNRQYLKKDWLGNEYWEDEKGNRTYERKDYLGNDIRDEEVKDGCFITTACIETKGLPDDCQELRVLRSFRDEYVRNLPNGNQVIQEYYEVAPQIVAAINRAASSKRIYLNLYEKVVWIVELIQSGRKDEAFNNCINIFNELRQKYL